MLRPSDFGGLFSAQRILVVGANGAGKTWFAFKWADRTHGPVFHNDALKLDRGWRTRPAIEIAKAQSDILARDIWIFEGGPSILTPQALSRAQVVVWLDMPRSLRVGRIIWRSLRYMGQTRPEHPSGNVDWPGRRQFRFLVSAWRSDAAMKRAVCAGLKTCDLPVVHVKTAADARAIF
jgi:adenylate kinase family enzyme